MKYMLLIYSDEKSWTQAEWAQCTVDSTAVCHELAAQGQFIAASPLHPVATAKSVRVRHGQRLITDGPFVETTEQLGGFYIIDVANLDEAIAIASRLPPAKKGTVEVRPIFKLDGLPSDQFELEPSDELPAKTKFMFLCYDDEAAWNNAGPEAHRAAMMEAVALTHQLDTQRQYITASPLHPVATATSVRIRHGQRIITDGPFAETREVLGGYYVIFAKDQTEAVEFAAKHSGARVGGVEVREIFKLPGLPAADDCEIVGQRDFPNSREEIFRAIENGDRLARWWGPNGFSNTFEQFDFQPGGEWKFVMHGPNGQSYDNHSRFASIAKPERVVINHLSAPNFTLTISLDETPSDATRVTWRMHFENRELRDKIAKFAVDANEQNFDRLAVELARGR